MNTNELIEQLILQNQYLMNKIQEMEERQIQFFNYISDVIENKKEEENKEH